MGFKEVKLYNFRNLEDSTINIDKKQVFLIGQNGQGKTNFLEAIYLLCFGSSFRKSSEHFFVKNTFSECSVIGTYNYEQLESEMKFLQKNKKRAIYLNDKLVKDRSEIILNIPSIIFSHDDMNIISGSPAERRKFFDQVISLYNKDYVFKLRKYNRILKERNASFKNRVVDPSLYNDKLIEIGMEIIKDRENTVQEFNKIFTPMYKEISKLNKDIEIYYKSSWKNLTKEEIQEKFKRNLERERMYKSTVSGPHRDNYFFVAGEQNFSLTASTGQRRVIALVIKLAQAIYYNNKTRRKPILLFDDVLLELDGEKKRKVISLLPDYEQAFFTFLPEENYQLFKKDDTIIFRVKEGKLIQDE